MKKRQVMALFMALVMVVSVMTGSPVAAVEAIDGDDQALAALQSAFSSYEGGSTVDAGYGNFGSYEAYLLMEAGADLDVWEKDDSSFEEDVRSLIETSSAAPEDMSAKRLAQDYAGAVALGMTDEADLLLAELEERQSTAGTSGAMDDSAYSDIPAYDILLRVEGTTPGALDLELAADYVLGQQAAGGGWPASWTDFQSTAQAVRVLAEIDELTDYRTSDIETAIDEGKTWLMDAQQEDGSFKAGDWDDVMVDTSEAVLTALTLGENPEDWTNDLDKSPVDYLLSAEWASLLSNSYGNAVSIVWGLDAYTSLGYDIADSAIVGVDVTLSETTISEIDITSAAAVKITLTDRIEVTTGAALTISDETVASLDYFPSVMAKAAGTADIAYTVDGVTDSETLTVTEVEGSLGPDAIRTAYEKFMAGTAVDAGWGKFSGYDVAILLENDVEIEDWVYNGTSMEASAQALIEASVADSDSMNAKRIAQDIYAAKALGMTDEKEALIDVLEARQASDGSFSGNMYVDYPAYDILLRAEELLENDFDFEAAVTYMTDNQDGTGAWPLDGGNWMDFMSSAQAVRILSALRDYTAGYNTVIDDALASGLDWLLEQQQPDGSFVYGWDDRVVDASDMIYTAVVLDKDAAEWTSDEGNSPMDFFEDNSFEAILAMSSDNVAACTAILDASVQAGNITSAEGDDSDDTTSTSDTAKVYVYVLGQDSEVLYGPTKVTVSEDDTYGLTAMSALDATGLDWSFSDVFDNFVFSIEGQENEGTSGWMYAVNGSSATVLATENEVETSDEIIWWYSSSATSGVPDWPSDDDDDSTVSAATTGTVIDEEAVEETLTEAADQIEGVAEGTVGVLNADSPMTDVKAEAIRLNMGANTVDLSGSFTGDDDLIIADDEIQMLVPADALEEAVTITAEELDADAEPESFGIKLQGAVYEFGPDGTEFDEPLTIAIQVAIDSDTDVDSLTPAWYDEDNGVWVPIAGVVDLQTGLVTFTVDHFTKFAVLENADRISFSDMADYGWAVDAVEILAGQGYINGTGDGYEPGRTITRAEFIKVMVMALDYEAPLVSETAFADVAADTFFAPYIQAAVDNGLVEGDADSSFRPDDNISRQEAVTILARAEAGMTLPDMYALDFKDAGTVPDWAVDGVTFAAYNGIIKGDTDGSFYGERSMTRAEAAVVVYRYLTYKMD